MVPEVGVEPTRQYNPATDFKSGVSAIPPLGRKQSKKQVGSMPYLLPTVKEYRRVFLGMRIIVGRAQASV